MKEMEETFGERIFIVDSFCLIMKVVTLNLLTGVQGVKCFFFPHFFSLHSRSSA